MMGLEPIRFAAPPLKMAVSPIPPHGQKQKKLSNCLTFSDPAGIQTQDPIIKSDVLYQLSYGVIARQL